MHALIDRRVDGVIIVPSGRDHNYLSAELRAGLSLVFLDRTPSALEADTVLADNRPGALKAVGHLIAAGHRRIGYAGDYTTIETARHRFAGYTQALSDAGITADHTIVRHGLHTIAAAESAVYEMLPYPNPPTALFASQNLVSIGANRALWQLGLRETIALVGFDDFVLADILRPGVTVIAQDAYGMGKLAAEILFARIDGDRSPFRIHIVPTQLMIRGSGEIAPRRRINAKQRPFGDP